MFERERRMYGLFRQLQQDDLIFGDSAHSYSIAVSRPDIDYYQKTGGVIMQSFLRDQNWMFFVENGSGASDYQVSIRAMRGHSIAVLRDIKGPVEKV